MNSTMAAATASGLRSRACVTPNTADYFDRGWYTRTGLEPVTRPVADPGLVVTSWTLVWQVLLRGIGQRHGQGL